ncbi:GNAT family N-acetyltransferase [Aliikangiella coralliicola]|uniref:GNAT family N-acetyltransferase n=1 Tax=Aliikangiella coralliicola TaxID=2592383 RepID=A0A545UI81_9GAMM|nr:GNAT family N-acetyltransferase [Aliikangiella coralliicola]TQV89172.1 GNAT family N-acetyltransferase [Aliikangiella coralliicola]
MSRLSFVPFKPEHLNACLSLFNTNLTGYFSPEEVSDFQLFLENLDQNTHYYVGFHHEQIIACGGWDKQDKGYFLRWGIVDNAQHTKGLGSELLNFRIKKIEALYGPVEIYIKTSGKAHGFFEKFGFETFKIVPDGIYQGIDEYRMKRSPQDS